MGRRPGGEEDAANGGAGDVYRLRDIAEDRLSAVEAGFDQHLSKPLSAEQLEAVVARAQTRR